MADKNKLTIEVNTEDIEKEYIHLKSRIESKTKEIVEIQAELEKLNARLLELTSISKTNSIEFIQTSDEFKYKYKKNMWNSEPLNEYEIAEVEEKFNPKPEKIEEPEKDKKE